MPGAVAWTGGKASLPDGKPAAPPATVEAGTPEQDEVIQRALGTARTMAAQGLAVLRAGPGNDRDRQLLQANFHTTDPALLGRAVDVLSEVQAGLSGSVPIEVEGMQFPLDEKVAGYVYGGPFAGFSDIHLAPLFFEKGADAQGGILVHEASHKYAGTGDHAYRGPGRYGELTPELALENADTYATFCELEQGDVRAAQEEERAAEATEAAKTHAEEVWAAWDAGTLAYGAPFTTSAGVEIPIGLVKGIILERFAERYPERRADIVAHLLAKRGFGVVACRDGYVAPENLVRGIADEEMI